MEKSVFETRPDIEEVYRHAVKENLGHHLVVYNDDVNTFDHVIECFEDILGHTNAQAEQCAIIIHEKGSCSVKNGLFKDLHIFRDQLVAEGIDARIHPKE